MMQTQALNTTPFTSAAALAPLESGDATEAPRFAPRYCPTELLAGFALLMAGHGRCVNTSMMLGDREYAMWQLGCAQALADDELAVISRRLFAYFDDRARA